MTIYGQFPRNRDGDKKKRKEVASYLPWGLPCLTQHPNLPTVLLYCLIGWWGLFLPNADEWERFVSKVKVLRIKGSSNLFQDHEHGLMLLSTIDGAAKSMANGLLVHHRAHMSLKRLHMQRIL